MADEPVRHILSLSGGKDSAALSIYMRDRVPDMEYIFHDTDKELPETYESFPVGGDPWKTDQQDDPRHELRSLDGCLRRDHPSNHRRWCTKLMKLRPF